MIGILRALLARHHVGKGDAARDDRRWDEARVGYERALKYAPSMTHIWVQLGHARKEAGRFEAAEAAYERALRQKPSDADIYLQLGHLHKIRGRVNEAILMYTQSARLNPHRLDALDELSASGYASDGRRKLGIVAIGSPHSHIFDHNIDLQVKVGLELVSAEEMLQLIADGSLHVAFTLHLDHSGTSATFGGIANVRLIENDMLECSASLPIASFREGRLGVLTLCPKYVDRPNSEAVVTKPVMVAVSPRTADLGRLFKALVSGSG